jgi:hypothetical protein
VDWEQIRIRFGIGQPPKRRWEVLYEQHKELLDGFWSLMLQLGRLPEPAEFPQTGELREKISSPKQALRMFIQKGGVEQWGAAENRADCWCMWRWNLCKVPFGYLSQSCEGHPRFLATTRRIGVGSNYCMRRRHGRNRAGVRGIEGGLAG